MPDVGAFLDDTDGDIVEAEFTVASGEYADKVMTGGGDTKVPIVIKLTIESPDLEKPAVQSFSVGSQEQWEIEDDGKSIKNVKNPDKHNFRKGSVAMALVESMMTTIGDGKLEKGQDFFIKRDTYMTEAKFYEGLSFHWATKELSFDIGGRKFTTKPPLPEKYIGEVKSSSKEKPASKKAESTDNEELDAVLVENAAGKAERELKSFVVRSGEFKGHDVYIKAVVSGKRLKELEDAGTLVKDPDSGKYI